MSKPLARYTYQITKRNKDVEYGSDLVYTVTVKASDLDSAKRKATTLGETESHSAWYSYRIKLQSIEEL